MKPSDLNLLASDPVTLHCKDELWNYNSRCSRPEIVCSQCPRFDSVLLQKYLQCRSNHVHNADLGPVDFREQTNMKPVDMNS